MIFENLFLALLGRRKIVVSGNHRVIVVENGKIAKILKAGKHRISALDTEIETHDFNSEGVFQSKFEHAIFQTAPDLAKEHIMDVRTATDEIKIVYRDEVILMVIAPDSKRLLWKDAGPFRIAEIAINEDIKIEPKLAKRLKREGFFGLISSFEVPEGYVGLMFLDGALDRKLAPGTHDFWNVNAKITVSLIDLRMRAHEVNGQEILTKDRVSLRVNISAEFTVTDPEKAVTAVQDHQEALHRSLQFAFRKTLGALTLDELLSEKVSVDAVAADEVRADMAKIGLSVGTISLKDVILPGEMREILNQVVTAQKEAEANVIRRREETNATRSLLNTAKVMAENPVMLRLKELEALETIAGKVDRLTVHNGTAGLMSDLVRLSEKE